MRLFPKDLLDYVRKTCAEVTVLAAPSLVCIDEEALRGLVEGSRAKSPVEYDASGWHLSATEIDMRHAMQYVFVLSALNFCFWPASFEGNDDDDARSLEYEDLAVGLKSAIKRDPIAFEGTRLANITKEELKAWVDFPERTMDYRLEAVRELGRAFVSFGDAATWMRESRHSAVRLVELVANRLPHFRDESVFRGRPVMFYKRAQILVADAWAMCGRRRVARETAVEEEGGEDDRPFGSFYDIDRLTMFADYRVPQILRHVGVLRYLDQAMRENVDGGVAELEKDSEAEVAIRAVCLTAVEKIAAALGEWVESVPGGGGGRNGRMNSLFSTAG